MPNDVTTNEKMWNTLTIDSFHNNVKNKIKEYLYIEKKIRLY